MRRVYWWLPRKSTSNTAPFANSSPAGSPSLFITASHVDSPIMLGFVVQYNGGRANDPSILSEVSTFSILPNKAFEPLPNSRTELGLSITSLAFETTLTNREIFSVSRGRGLFTTFGAGGVEGWQTPTAFLESFAAKYFRPTSSINSTSTVSAAVTQKLDEAKRDADLYYQRQSGGKALSRPQILRHRFYYGAIQIVTPRRRQLIQAWDYWNVKNPDSPLEFPWFT
ncbi:MAG: hypothetical protein M1825_004103 [Sarcosagium campestre]|nr:MAG: hypothetical protein M1825_004103 [Sarcosagium campestre]